MSTKRPKVAVVGSFMMDLVVKAERRPKVGETLVGEEFGMFLGGKGTNQAIAAARLGAEVHMIGRLGQDQFGDIIIESLQKDNIHTDFIVKDAEVGTGIATPVIDADGNNSIIIIPRANMRLTVANVEKAASAIAEADVLLLQLEVPIEPSKRAAEIAGENSTVVILNPAPACQIPNEFLKFVDYLTPNEIETEMLTGVKVSDQSGAERAARVLLDKGVSAVVLTLGSRGTLLLTENTTVSVPAHKVNVVDTTAAGDAFCGGFAFGLAQGQKLTEAVRCGNAAGALAVTVMGAEPSMPTSEAVRELLNR